jgi:probable F420-dependent oxidoreductase
MDVGLALPQFDYSVPGERPLTWATLSGWARRADELGFASVWLADHLFLEIEKYGGPPGRFGTFDPLVVLGALSRVTTRARLGTLVLCAQLRPPTVLAKALATVDRLSGGRLVVGLGAGWYEAEYREAAVPFRAPGERLGQLAEAVELVRAMLGGGPCTFDGRWYAADEAPCLPPAVQRPHPPIWVGGRGDRLLDVVARHADGWNTVWSMTPETYRQRLGVLAAACDRAGRDPATVTLSLGLTTLVGEDERDLARRFDRLQRLSAPGILDGQALATWREGKLVGTVEQVREQVGGWADLGVGTVVAAAGALPFALASGDDVDLLAAALCVAPPGG